MEATQASEEATSVATDCFAKSLEVEVIPKLRFQSEEYESATAYWPGRGRCILAQFTETAILVYQAFNEAIAHFAVEHQCFEGAPGYSLQRMTWIKTNFLWMMYRCGWARKHNQERVLGIWIKRSFFESLIRCAESTQASSIGKIF